MFLDDPVVQKTMVIQVIYFVLLGTFSFVMLRWMKYDIMVLPVIMGFGGFLASCFGCYLLLSPYGQLP